MGWAHGCTGRPLLLNAVGAARAGLIRSTTYLPECELFVLMVIDTGSYRALRASGSYRAFHASRIYHALTVAARNSCIASSLDAPC